MYEHQSTSSNSQPLLYSCLQYVVAKPLCFWAIMSWIVSLLVAFLSGVASLILGGFVADACVSWYRIPTREGGAGYFVVFTALLAGMAGTILGLIVARIVASIYAPGFIRELGGSLSVIFLVTGIVALTARLLGDVPPTIEGRDLILEVEFRFPHAEAGVKPPMSTEDWLFSLSSISGHEARKSKYGKIHSDLARLEDGQWIVPASIELFTERGGRLVTIAPQDSAETIGFLLPLPRRPGRNYLEWSDWLTNPKAEGREKSRVAVSCRFRLQQTVPPQPPQSPVEYDAEQAALKEAKFVSLPMNSPIETWFPYLEYPQPQTQRALVKIVARKNLAEELGVLVIGEDPEKAAAALNVIAMHPRPGQELIPVVKAAGHEIAARITVFNNTPVESDPGFQLAVDPCVRFHRWIGAAASLLEKEHADFTPELKEILELSRARPESHAMRSDINRVASYYLQKWAGIEPLPTDPKPR